MRKFWHDTKTVMKKELIVFCIKKQFIVFAIFLICLTAFININVYRGIVPKLSAIQPNIAEQMVHSMLSRTAVFTGLIIAASMFQMFSREKIERTIETLACYPISLNAIWFGKVLAIWVVYVLGNYLTGITLFVSTCFIEAAILPLKAATIITFSVVMPILGMALFLVLSMLLWVTRLGKIGTQLIFLVFFISYFVGARPGGNFSLWLTLWVYLIIAGICAGISLVLRVFLFNRERLIL